MQRDLKAQMQDLENKLQVSNAEGEAKIQNIVSIATNTIQGRSISVLVTCFNGL